MARKAEAKAEEILPEEAPKSSNGFFDYLRFGESYTSLILGIIVVIISTALLLSFVHNRNAGSVNTPADKESQFIAQITQQPLDVTFEPTDVEDQAPSITKSPSPTATPTITSKPTVKPTTIPTTKPTVKPTTKPTVKPTAKPTAPDKKLAQATTAPTKAVAPTPTPTKGEEKPAAKSGEYIVKKGDTLWSIAEKQYKSGYNWVDIARANKLSNPGDIHVGNKIVLPKVTAKAPTNVVKDDKVASNEQQKTTVQAGKITSDSYKIVRGDTLWSIAVRAYGDGYKWADIAKANKLTNPGLIHADNTLKLPRGK